MSKSLALFLKASLEGLKDAGVKDVVLSPGSRSTPLALLVERDPNLTVHMDVDERSAAFFALGLSKVSKNPVVCICTSGTAAANYFPAICEAQESQIPLVIITTDRPHELRHNGAPQTMDQIALYGNKVKQAVEFPLPEATDKMLQYSYTQSFQLTKLSLTTPKGPVHANFPFREPLIPDDSVDLPKVKRKKYIKGIKQVEHLPTEIAPFFTDKKGIILVGEMMTDLEIKSLVFLAEKLKWPIFSESLANIKTSSNDSKTIINHHDLLFKHLSFNQKISPDIIIRFGRALLSKTLNQYLSSYQGEYILVDDSGLMTDYSHQVSTVIESEPNYLINSLIYDSSIENNNSDWLHKWQELDNTVSATLRQTKACNDYSELSITKSILENIPQKGQLFISNSMPIRDVDTIQEKSETNYSLFATRGINGIDGILSTAFGMTATNPKVWNGLIIGDLSFFHSMNGLSLGKKYHLPLTIFVINNDGGGIFSMLPQSQLPKPTFESLFGTPQSLNFQSIAEGFGCSYYQITNKKDWNQLSDELFDKPAFRIVEIITSREENTKLRQELNQLIRSQLIC